MKPIITPDILLTILKDIVGHLTPAIAASDSKADDFALYLLTTIINYLEREKQKTA